MAKINSRPSPKTKHPVRIAVTLLILFVLLYLGSARMFHAWPFERATFNPSTATTPSKSATAQSDFNGGDKRSTDTNTNTAANGADNTLTDNNGAVSSTPQSSQWSKSTDGSSIIVYGPAANSNLSDGAVLSGAATGSRVSFRLVDNLSGVIANGSISVVNGKFSGTLHFSTQATEGQIVVFDQAPDGTESNNTTIPVRFNS